MEIKWTKIVFMDILRMEIPQITVCDVLILHTVILFIVWFSILGYVLELLYNYIHVHVHTCDVLTSQMSILHTICNSRTVFKNQIP